MSGRGIAGFVLAGGRSRRMGRDKALLVNGQSTLLEHALGVLRAVCDDVAIAGSRDYLSSFAPVIADSFLDSGPLSGIHAALRQSQYDWNLFLAVDLPRIEVVHVNTLLACPRMMDTTAVVADVNGQIQPLFGLYHRKLAGPIEQALCAGERAVIPVIESVSGSCGLMRVQLSTYVLLNVNTPEDMTLLD